VPAAIFTRQARTTLRRRRSRTVLVALAAAVASVLPVGTVWQLAARHRPSDPVPAATAAADSRPDGVDRRCRDAALGWVAPVAPEHLAAGAVITEVLWCAEDWEDGAGSERVGGVAVKHDAFTVDRRADTGLAELTAALLAPDQRSGSGGCWASKQLMPRLWVQLSTGEWVQPIWPQGRCGPLADGIGIVRGMPFRDVAREPRGAPPLATPYALTSLGDLTCPGHSVGTQYDSFGPAKGVKAADIIEEARKVLSLGSPAAQRWRDASSAVVAKGRGFIVWLSDEHSAAVAGVQFERTGQDAYLADLSRRCG
jgi:hypothetical protein